MLKAASNNPTTKFYMMPPMTRTTPIWLESRLPAITDTMLTRVRGVDNLILLPPFTVLSADLEADGIHLHRKSQSRLFSYIMDSLFPDKSSAKMKNITRDRTESEDEANSPPNKKIAEAIITGTPMDSSSLTADEWVTQGPPSGDVAMAPVALPVNSTAVPTLPPTLSTTAHVHVAAPPMPADVGAVSDDGAELANPELKQLYQMLSKKMDVAHDVTTGVQVRVGKVEVHMEETSRRVECNTLLLRSLHLRTASQAETLDAHSNTLNLNVVMISGVPASLFPETMGELPGTKTVMDRLIKFTPLLISGIKFAVYAKYIKHHDDKLPNIKVFFINSDTALAFRDSANKLRIAKTEFWSTVYVSNDPTKSTRVRICILQALAKRLTPLPANAGKTIFVSRFDVKPQLCFKVGTRVEKRFDFVAAMEKYRSVLKPEDKEAARKVAGKTFSEDDLRQFIVI